MKIENKLILNETAKTTKKTVTNFDEILNANLNKKSLQTRLKISNKSFQKSVQVAIYVSAHQE